MRIAIVMAITVAGIAGCATVAETRTAPARISYIAPVEMSKAVSCIVEGVQGSRLLGVPFSPSVVPYGNGGWSVSHGDAQSIIDLSQTEGGVLIEHRRRGLIMGDPFESVVQQCKTSLLNQIDQTR